MVRGIKSFNINLRLFYLQNKVENTVLKHYLHFSITSFKLNASRHYCFVLGDDAKKILFNIFVSFKCGFKLVY